MAAFHLGVLVPGIVHAVLLSGTQPVLILPRTVRVSAVRMFYEVKSVSFSSRSNESLPPHGMLSAMRKRVLMPNHDQHTSLESTFSLARYLTCY